MARDFHADNAKIAIEPILTSNRCEQRLQGRDLPSCCAQEDQRCFRREMLSHFAIQRGCLNIRASGLFARECNG